MTGSEIEHLKPMDSATLKGFCELVNQRSGLIYDASSQNLLERRLASRVLAKGIDGFPNYLKLLKARPGELDYVFETLTTKETYFFRQEYQFKTFVDEVIPLLIREGAAQNRLTIWSAGCSSGEETYSIAMLLIDHPLLQHWKVRIIGTDLCASNIEWADRGVYRPTSFRSTSQEQISRHFSACKEGHKVNADVRRMVHFSVGNLMSAQDVRSVGRVDVIFCRNVLIYFDTKSRQIATNLFYERLLPGGFLLLGHSESLLNTQTRFEPVHLEGDIVYRRPLLDSTRPRARKTS